MKKIFSFLMVLCMLISLVPFQASAAYGPFDIWAFDGNYQQVDISHTQAYAGETVTVTPKAGYRITHLEVRPSDSEPLPLEEVGNGYTFVMPEGSVEMLVLVETLNGGGVAHEIWLLSAGGGNPTVSPAAAAPGETVVVAPNPNSGNTFKNIQIDYYRTDGHNEIYYLDDGVTSFVMPDDVEAGGKVKVTVYYQAGASEGPQIVNLYASGEGTADAPATANPGETVTVTVNPQEGCKVSYFYVMNEATGATVSFTRISKTQYTFVMPENQAYVLVLFEKGVDDFVEPEDPKPEDPKPEDPKPEDPKPEETNPEITVVKPEGGTATAPDSAKPGDTVIVNINCDKGFVVDQIIVIDEEGNQIAVSDYSFVMPGTSVTIKVTFKADVPEQEIPTVPMFRLYDPNSGEHFYTGSEEERDNLVKEGWNYEGVGFNFPPNKGEPVYRLYEPVTGEHLYTMDKAEKERLLAAGWNYEYIAFNSAASTEVPQYRLHNPNATRGAYHFTGSVEERDWLVSLGWEYQGIGFYSSWN